MSKKETSKINHLSSHFSKVEKANEIQRKQKKTVKIRAKISETEYKTQKINRENQQHQKLEIIYIYFY